MYRAERGGHFVIFYFRESLQSTSNTLPSPEPLKENKSFKKYFSVSALSIFIYCACFKHLANVFFVVGQKVILTCFLINLRFLAKVSPLIFFMKIFYSGHLIPTPLLINFCKKILTRTFSNVSNTNFCVDVSKMCLQKSSCSLFCN